MKYIIYVSCETVSFSGEDLKKLLETSRKNNKQLNITGMLLYAEGNFIQVIEGEESAIKALYTKIKMDERHKAFSILLQGNIEKRSFAEWSMGFKIVSKEDFSSIAGFKSVGGANPDALTEISKGPVLQLLKSFLKVNSLEARYSS